MGKGLGRDSYALSLVFFTFYYYKCCVEGLGNGKAEVGCFSIMSSPNGVLECDAEPRLKTDFSAFQVSENALMPFQTWYISLVRPSLKLGLCHFFNAH